MEVLQQKFGHDDFRAGQKTVMDWVLQRHSALAVMPTGHGKSICFQLPALFFDGLTLVISPLIALMDDQVKSLHSKGIEAAAFHTGLRRKEMKEVMWNLQQKRLKILYVSPERLNNSAFLEAMKNQTISLLVIDEAHCVSEWGHEFRPSYLMVRRFAEEVAAEQVLALTATATSEIANQITERFGIDEDHVLCGDFHRENLDLDFLIAPRGESLRREFLFKVCQESPRPAIVYVTRQATADEVAEYLRKMGLPAKSYHAGQEAEARADTQAWFQESCDGIIVATIAFGMGVDKEDVRSVIHYNIPKSLEGYAQEIGRAGRDGMPATCKVLASPEDVPELQAFAYSETPALDSVRMLVEDLFSENADVDPDRVDRQGDKIMLSQYRLSTYHDIHPNSILMLLAFMDIYFDIWRETTPYIASKRFQLKEGQDLFTMVKESSLTLEEQDAFLQHCKKQITWTHCQVGRSSVAERAFNKLEINGAFSTTKVAGVKKVYQIKNYPQDLTSLAKDLHGMMAGQERQNLERLQQVCDLITANECQTGVLLRHFEGKQKPGFACGHCRFCREGRALELELETAAVNEDDWAEFAADPKLRTYDDPRLLVRVAIGKTSPRITKEKLINHKLFGAFCHNDFRHLLPRCQNMASDIYN